MGFPKRERYGEKKPYWEKIVSQNVPYGASDKQSSFPSFLESRYFSAKAVISGLKITGNLKFNKLKFAVGGKFISWNYWFFNNFKIRE
jgi:hypothetical protein